MDHLFDALWRDVGGQQGRHGGFSLLAGPPGQIH
jgi:hypothetical protein